MPFPTNPALEAAVVADAENDLPRLVYADWLDEHGDPARAAFIRSQVALWDLPPTDPTYPDWLELRREAFDRVDRRGADLAPKVPAAVNFHDSLYDPDNDGCTRSYHRGFPYLIGEPSFGDRWSPEKEARAAERFAAALPQVLATTTVRGFDFSTWFSRQLGRILPAAECERFSALSADNLPHDRGEVAAADALVRSPIAGSVRWLDLDLFGDADVLPLAKADFPHLHRWDAHHGIDCSPAAFKKLISARWFHRLHRLLVRVRGPQAKPLWSALATAPDLHTVQVWVSDAGVLAPLATARPLRSLGRLHLHATSLSAADIAGLVRARLPKLAAFEVRGLVRNDTVNELLSADWFTGLKVLTLDTESMSDQGAVAVGRSAVAANLRSLTLSTPKLGKKAFASLAADYSRLTTLDLDPSTKAKATAADMTAFAAALALPRLRHLSLKSLPIGDAAAAALANNPSLANLTRLAIDYAAVGGMGVRALVTSPHLQRLVFLSLNGSPGGAGVDALTDPGVLPLLARCWLPDGVAPKVFTKLRKARGNIFVGGPN